MSTINSVGEPIDWQQFYTLFKEYAQWDLEWHNGSKWVSVKEDMTVQRSFPEPHHCKFNLIFDASQAGNYRLTFAVDRVVRDYVEKIDNWQYELNYGDYATTFDWSDAKDIPGIQFSHGIKNDRFWFRMRRDNVPLGAHVEIDPATVHTSTVRDSVLYAYQRKSFYAEGLFWAFYSNNNDGWWEWSDDGVDWSNAPTSVGPGGVGYDLTVWFDGTYIHYVRYTNRDLFYRRGAPENDGTITWSAVEQTVYDGSSGDEYRFPTICVDTNGYAWVGVYNDQPIGNKDFPVVLKNDNNDGTWALDFAYELSAVDSTSWRVCPVPLTGGKVYVVYTRYSQHLFGQLYNAGWGAEEDITDYDHSSSNYFSAVAMGDNVHVVYTRETTNQIRHNKRVWGVGWDANDVLVQDAVTLNTSAALSGDPSTGDLYCFWTDIGTDHVYYNYYDGDWDDGDTDWIDEEVDDIPADYMISSFYEDYGGYIGLLYVTKTGSPYNVRFEFLDLNPPPDAAPQGTIVPKMMMLLIAEDD